MSKGYTRWSGQFLQNPPDSAAFRPIINGYQMAGVIESIGLQDEPTATDLLTFAGSHISQLLWHGSDQPLSMGESEFPVSFRATSEEDYYRWREALHGPPVLFFPSVGFSDVWLIKGAASSQTRWRTSRRLGWDGTTRTHTTHPPKVLIDGVAQSIITTGTPAAGEVYVPTSQVSGYNFSEIETPSGLSGERLVLRYWPELWVRLSRLSGRVRQVNDLRFTVTLEERYFGVYGGVDGQLAAIPRP